MKKVVENSFAVTGFVGLVRMQKSVSLQQQA